MLAVAPFNVTKMLHITTDSSLLLVQLLASYLYTLYTVMSWLSLGLPSLVELDLSHTALSNRMLIAGCLAQCLALKVLNLSYTRVSTKGIVRLLWSSSVSGTHVSLPSGVACLQRHYRLQRLNLRGTYVHPDRACAILAHVAMVDVNRLQTRLPMWDMAGDTDDDQLEGMDPEAALHT
jgi:hypothetical protein